MNDPRIDEITGGDPRLVKALSEVGLSTDDLTEAGRRFFRFSESGGLIGFIGWEITDEATASRAALSGWTGPQRRLRGDSSGCSLAAVLMH
jgi:arsenate reductase (glutaredoxin)